MTRTLYVPGGLVLQAVLVMWPDSEAMHSLLGTLVGCIGGSRPPNLEAKAAATTAALFRGTQGETFMRRCNSDVHPASALDVLVVHLADGLDGSLLVVDWPCV